MLQALGCMPCGSKPLCDGRTGDGVVSHPTSWSTHTTSSRRLEHTHDEKGWLGGLTVRNRMIVVENKLLFEMTNTDERE